MQRTDERQWIVKLIFQHHFNEIDLENIDYILSELNLDKSEFIKDSLVSIINNIDTIDSIIESKLNKKKINSILAIEKAILRVSINEFVIQKHVPVSVSINEAVNLAKSFSNQESYKFINGVLSSIAKEND